ncbi:MAG: CPBP family intramembrane metalloprotease [Phenylobacterium sp.]|uniref:CPBP family intramembrane glutamic endopeptidase n=1 Tax=Phenylobacterium sp. TaxID=1871053 RepID=UPI001222E763|nr:CPBP family intramembrane glutamic endopeptidase [Phenylobacterium sp.]TAL38176.1 MAG: CPBP family intramembrane metalloprotease [Phenylobacterium sp.]
MADALPRPKGFAFLETTSAVERGLPHAVVTLALGGLAGLAAAFVVALLVTLVGAGVASGSGDLGYATAVDLLAKGEWPARTLGTYAYELAMVGGASIAAAAAFIGVAARRAGRPIRTFLTTAPRFRWRHALVGLAIFLPVVAAEIWLSGLVNPSDDTAPLAAPGASFQDRLVYIGAAVGFLWCAALAEEILFRGWLMQQTRALTRSLIAVLVINAVAFSLAHGDLTLGGFVTRLALGAGWAWIVLRLGGVEFTAGAHLANNLGIALLAQPVLLTVSEPEPFDPLSVALQIGTTGALVLGVEWWVRRKSTSGVDLGDCGAASSPPPART